MTTNSQSTILVVPPESADAGYLPVTVSFDVPFSLDVDADPVPERTPVAISSPTEFHFAGPVASTVTLLPWARRWTSPVQSGAGRAVVTGSVFDPGLVRLLADGSVAAGRIALLTDPVLGPAPLSIGRYYAAGFGGQITTEALTIDREYAVPVDLDRASRTFDRIGISVSTAGTAGSVVRLGIRDTGADGLPGALISDFGTVDSATTGDKELVINRTVTPSFGRRVWLTAAPQVAVPTLRVFSVSHHPAISANSLAGVYQGGALAFQATGVAGALPAMYPTPGSPRTQAPVIAYRLSA
jgi:hypothetical protein